jgi:O-antigen/teichoic acid export membrane protein
MGSRQSTGAAEASKPEQPVHGQLVRGMLFLGAGEIAAKLCCFVAFTILGRLLGPERYGSLEFVLALIVFFTLPADSGLGSYGAREIARGRYAAPRLLAGLATLRLLLALGSFALLIATALALPASTGVLLAVYGIGILLMPLQLQWLFQGRGKMEWVAAASVVRYGVFAGLIFCCLRPESTLVQIGIFECISLLASSALCVWAARSDLRTTIAAWPPRLADLVTHLRGSWPIGLSQISWAALWYFVTVFVGIWIAGESLGQFTASHRMVMALHTFVWMYFYNLLPAISRAAALRKDGMQDILGPSLALTSWAGGLAALLVSLLAGDIVALAYGAAYRPAGPLLAVLIWAIPLALVGGHYRSALIATDHERLEFRCNAVGALVAVGLGALLIPSRGAMAAALALVASAVVVGVLAHAAARATGIAVPSIARVLPASSALLIAGLTARSLGGLGSWVAASGACAAYLSLFILFEFGGPLRWRIRPVQPEPMAARSARRGVETSLDFQGPISA